MRSRGNRVGLERGLRAGSFALLAFGAWALLTGGQAVGRSGGQQEQIPARLADWTRRAPAETLALALTIGATIGRARLAEGARRRRHTGDMERQHPGHRRGRPARSPIRPAALPCSRPRRRARCAWRTRSAPSTRPPPASPARYSGSRRGPGVCARPRVVRARARPVRTRCAPRHAVVLGRAGWEARFVISALEERGWIVDARLSWRPASRSRRACRCRSTPRAMPCRGDRLAGAGRGGGGGPVRPIRRRPGAQPLGSGRAGRARGGSRRGPCSSRDAHLHGAESPRFARAGSGRARSDAIVLERQRGLVVVAARRVGAGRVVQTGYDETWRWRLGGDADAMDAHRSGGRGLSRRRATGASQARGVGQAGAGGRRRHQHEVGDRAPLASLVAALGPLLHGRLHLRPCLIPESFCQLLPSSCSYRFCWSGISRRLRGAA